MKNEKSISEAFKHEWMMREHGSYEDSGKSESHVYSILARSPKGKVRWENEEEKLKLEKSASYVSDGYDDDHQIKASESIARFIKL